LKAGRTFLITDNRLPRCLSETKRQQLWK